MAYLFMLKQLWRYAGEERWKVVLYYLLHAISILGELGKPYAFALIVNAIQANRPTLLHDVSHGLLVYAASVLTFQIMHRPSRYIELSVAFRNRRRFIDAMYDKLQSLPLQWHTEHHSGNLINRINTAAEALHSFGVAQMNYVATLIKFWGPLIILWRMSLPIALASLLMGVTMVIVTRFLYHRIVPLCRSANESFHDFAAAFFDYMSNMKTIITLRLGRYVKRDLDTRLARAFPFLMRENNVTQVKCVSVDLLTLLLETGVVYYYIHLQQQAHAVILIGSVTALFQYLGQLMESFHFYAGEYEDVIHWKVDFESITPVLKATGQRKSQKTNALGEWKQLEIRPFSYTYGNGTWQLQDISLQLYRGQKVALVGESGSGKSTLLQVLRGLTEVHGATMQMDDRVSPLSALAHITTLIPQEPEIFENTLRHNITLGIPATDDEVRYTVWVAAFDHVMKNLPLGLESDIREKGVNLSGGERQRLALARGIFALRDSSIVLLDEPTSNIDPRTEWTIFTRLFEEFRGRSVVASLHRLHLLHLFDYVYVMQAGRIVEAGTFEKLCTQQGEFSRLWAMYQAEEVMQETGSKLV